MPQRGWCYKYIFAPVQGGTKDAAFALEEQHVQLIDGDFTFTRTGPGSRDFFTQILRQYEEAPVNEFDRCGRVSTNNAHPSR